MIFCYVSESLLCDNCMWKFNLYATFSASVNKNISLVVNGIV